MVLNDFFTDYFDKQQASSWRLSDSLVTFGKQIVFGTD